jgi:hypothetical protein
MGTPEWLKKERKITSSNGAFNVEPSERRIRDRVAVYQAIVGKDRTSIEKIDEIIDHFRGVYEGESWAGLSWYQRKQLFREGDGRCMWCKKPLSVGTFSVEHIIPLAEGGTWDWGNLGVACKKCNSDRGSDGVILDSYGFHKSIPIDERLQQYTPRQYYNYRRKQYSSKTPPTSEGEVIEQAGEPAESRGTAVEPLEEL